MKIVQLNCVYGAGSTGKIVRDLHVGYLERGIESHVVFSRGAGCGQNVHKLSNEFVTKIQSLFSKLTGNVYGGSWINTLLFLNLLRRIRPDIVHLQCINANTINVYYILRYLHKNNINTVLTYHAEFMYTGGCAHAFECQKWREGCIECPCDNRSIGTFIFKRTHYHWRKIHEIYRSFIKLSIIAVSPWLKQRAQDVGGLKSHISVIFNGLNTNVFNFQNREKMRFVRDKYNLSLEKKIILYVTPNYSDPNKGGEYLIQIARQFISQPNICFVIVGEMTHDDWPDNIVGISYTKNSEELAALYSTAVITLVLSKRETFSMVCAESLCCGTPVIGFRAGGPESIGIKEYSFFVDYGDIDSVIEKMNVILRSEIKKDIIAKNSEFVYSQDRMIERHLELYRSIIEDKSA